MQRAFRQWSSGWLVVACTLFFPAFGCGDDESPPKDEPQDAGNRDADSPNMPIPRAGRGGGGGAGGVGGNGGGAAPDPSAYMCQPKPGDTGGSKESGAECCDGLGTCGESGGENTGLPHESCKASPDLRCVPKSPVSEEDGGTPGFASCRVQFPGSPPTAPSFEGRCLPSCFVRHSPIASRLSQSTCDDGETCSPCYNPLTGNSTGTCERLGDSPLEPPLTGFGECATGLGYCVPAYAAGGSAAQLRQLTCAAGELCAPKIKVADPEACFERCNAGEWGAGACVPQFLAELAGPFLSGEGCRTGELCTPCVALGARTSVCD